LKQTIRFTRSVDEVRLAYAESGTGPPLVKAANWLSHLEFDWQSPLWRHWFGFFSSAHRLIRYDPRGCGLSDWDVADLTLAAQVADLEAVVESAHVDRFALIGISQGGAVAVEYAIRHPERVSHLVLYGAFARGWKHRGEEIARQFRALHDLVRLGWGQENPAFRKLFATMFVPDASDELERWFSDLMRWRVAITFFSSPNLPGRAFAKRSRNSPGKRLRRRSPLAGARPSTSSPHASSTFSATWRVASATPKSQSASSSARRPSETT